jgi:hypothetical protein
MNTIFKQRLTNNEWAVLKDIKDILEVGAFYIFILQSIDT